MAAENSKVYFQRLNETLKAYKRAVPLMLVDLDRLDENISLLRSKLNPMAGFRIVVKSLPSFELIDYVMRGMNTRKLMVFHQPFLTDLSAKLDHHADVLLGKPMPVRTARYYYEHLPTLENKFDPYRQIQWLVDTPQRIMEYVALAGDLHKKLRLNLEIDVGLHRGGFADIDSLREGLRRMESHGEKVAFSGFMGYDPHVVKIPGILRSQEQSFTQSNNFYTKCKDLVQAEFPALWREDLVFNGAGSPTINLHQTGDSPLNDLAAGSCLVMPTTFDGPLLQDFKPACFIATPVLKKFKHTTLPGLEKFRKLLNLISSRNRQSYFIYGGYWKADYCFPSGLQQNSLFGASTNQTMLNAPTTAELEVDDFVFLRPRQSEFVFLQFGEVLTCRKQTIVDKWSLLRNY